MKLLGVFVQPNPAFNEMNVAIKKENQEMAQAIYLKYTVQYIFYIMLYWEFNIWNVVMM